MSAAAAKRTVLAAVSVALLGAIAVAGPAGGTPPGKQDRVPPTAPENFRVKNATPSAVLVEWDPSQDDVGVAGYYVYGDRGRATVSNSSDSGEAVSIPAYEVKSLDCGESATIAVEAFDFDRNRSDRVPTTVSTAACQDVRPPTTPSGFRQQATTRNSVVLAWEASSDDVGVVGYGVYRNLQRIGSPAEPAATLDGLSCGSTYSYAVDAVDAAGNRSPLGTAYVQTASCSDGQPPSAPTDLIVTSRTTTSISLSWSPSDDNVGVAGYRISVGGTPVTTVPQPSATLSNLSCGTSYAVGVDAFDAAGNRSPAAAVNAATDACPPPSPSGDTTPPSTPTGLGVSNVSQTGLTLAWNASNDNIGVAGYDVYRNGAKIASVTSTNSSQTGLSCGTSYTFAVVSLDAAGNSSQQAQLGAFTLACSTPVPLDTIPPSQPTNLGISSVTRTSVTLTWGPSTDNVGVAGYRTYVNGSPVSTSAQPGATVSNLSCGTAYTLEVDAFDAAGNRSTRSSVIGSTAACADTQPPTAPANVAATARTATSIALSWAASSDNVGVFLYGLYKGGALVATTSETTHIFSGLACNTNYTLSVDAWDAAGNGSDLTTVMVATTACPDTTPPSTPTGLAASNVTQTGLTLTWTASSDNVGVTGYDVYRNGAKMATVTSTSSTQTGLSCGTPYTFAVAALDAAGNSSQQAQLNASTSACSSPPPPPSGVTYPASYYTGPLGQNNILPTKQGAFLNGWYSETPDGGVSLDQFKAGILRREADMGRKYDGVMVHHAGGGTLNGMANCFPPERANLAWEDWVATGHNVLVSWAPDRSITDVNLGLVDTCFQAVADLYKTRSYRVMLRLWWEFDGNWTKWYGCGQPFIDAWRRVVGIFQARGATNVGFWWNPGEGTDRACIDSSYPGDTYVDWVGSEAYNFCLVNDPSCFASPWHSGWGEFSECVDYEPGANFQTQHSKWGPRKPFVVGEMGTVYDPANPSKKGQWFRNVVAAAKNMEYLRGITYYDVDVSVIEGPKNNFKVDYPISDPSVYAGWKALAADPWFNTR